ncbi:hypothetical protein ACWIID_46190 [Streptomyces phaeochromogenes]
MPAQAGEDVQVGAAPTGKGVSSQHKPGQLHGRRHGGRNGQRAGAQRPLGGAEPCGAPGGLGEHGGIEQLSLQSGAVVDRAVQPAGVLQLMPQFRAAAQPHTAQAALRQPDTPLTVGAQCALQGQQSGGGRGEAGQRGGEVGEHLPHPLLLARPVRQRVVPALLSAGGGLARCWG